MHDDLPRPVGPGTHVALYSVTTTRQLERAAANRLPPHTLMQRAGLATARLALALAPHARRIWIACGPGNNGGDGLEAASLLQRWGCAPEVTWVSDESRLPDDAKASLLRARANGVRFVETAPEGLERTDLCVDALLGIGATRAPDGRIARLLTQLHAADAPSLAVDVPTGLDADTGRLLRAGSSPNQVARAPRHTLTLLTCKPGLFTAEGRDACGSIWFSDLQVAPGDVPPLAWLNLPVERLPRLHASHKGSYGDVVVVGGASEPPPGGAMTGAALLAASAALRSGAGRVYVCLLGSAPPAPMALLPELMTRDIESLALEDATVVCGCGGGGAVRAVLPRILHEAARLVLDADGLNAVAQEPALRAALAGRSERGLSSVLTPHPLEAARLLGLDSAHIQADRLAAASALAARFACTVLLKGSGTIIAAADGTLPRINPTGNARLATPGSGDVLAGLVGARLAAGMTAFDAACDAAFEHGLIAEAWPAHRALTASRLSARLTPR